MARHVGSMRAGGRISDSVSARHDSATVSASVSAPASVVVSTSDSRIASAVMTECGSCVLRCCAAVGIMPPTSKHRRGQTMKTCAMTRAPRTRNERTAQHRSVQEVIR